MTLGRTASEDERGASAVEYGLIVFAIAGLIAATVFMFGGFVRDNMTDSCQRLGEKMAPSATC